MQFNEPAWIRLLFTLSDTQAWISEMEKDLFNQLPITNKKQLFRKDGYITAPSVAHILERHYYKIPRHPGTAKFTISVPDILHWIRAGCQLPARPQAGTINFIRCYDTGEELGHDQYGQPTTVISIITSSGGEVITAFPGGYKDEPVLKEPSLVPNLNNE